MAHGVELNDSMQSTCALGGDMIRVTDYGMLETGQTMPDRCISWFDVSLWMKYGDAFIDVWEIMPALCKYRS